MDSRDRLFTRPFVLCSLGNFAQCLAFNLFLHFPGYLKDLGATEVQIGFVVSLTAVSAIVVRRPLGPAMDSRGRREIIIVGNLLNALVCALYLTVDGLGPWILAIRVVHGLAEAMLFTGLFTYAADCVPARRRTEGLALFGASGMLPISLGGLLGDAILARHDYDALFLAALGFALLSLVLSLPLRDEPRRRAGGEPARGFGAALRQRDLLPLWWMGGSFALALASAFVFVKTFVMDTGIGSVGGFFSAYAGAAIVLRVFFGWVPDRVGLKRVLFPALLCLAIGFALLAGATRASQVVVAGVFCGLGHGMTFPILFALVVTRVREADRGSAMAIFTALFDTGVLVGGPVFGLVIVFAGYPPMFALAAILVLVGSAVFAFWDREN